MADIFLFLSSIILSGIFFSGLFIKKYGMIKI